MQDDPIYPKPARFTKRVVSTDLMEQVAAPENLLSAWRAVRGNIPRYRRARSAGPDGLSMDDFERELPSQLGALRHMLLKDRYHPQPPAVFKLRKRSGGERKIAVLNITDRVAQRAAQQVIEPLWEPSFLNCSYGFRPGLSTQQAVAQVRELRQEGNFWLVDGDIAACFDSLDHEILLKRVQTRVQDPRVIRLLHLWIAQGILEHGIPARESGWLPVEFRMPDAIKKGAEWFLGALNGPEDNLPYSYQPGLYGQMDDPPIPAAPYGRIPYERDPYTAAAMEQGLSDDRYDSELPVMRPYAADLRKQAARQIAAGGMMLGASWVRPMLARAGQALIVGLKSQLGRELLKKGVLAGGGVVGAAVGVGAAAWLVYRELAPSQVGILQGSPLSPLLANVYLHAFDLGMTRSGFHLVRFADDWVVCCPSEETAERAYNQAVISLSKIRLKLNTEKTHILPPSEPLNWLGDRVQPVRRNKWQPYT
jgi:RNA-directed DNA polymerase